MKINEVGIPHDASAEPGLMPRRGKVSEGLPLDNYPMSAYEIGDVGRVAVESGAVHLDREPINSNPEISTPEPSPEKFGMSRGKDGAN